jgi:hypothetical protein
MTAAAAAPPARESLRAPCPNCADGSCESASRPRWDVIDFVLVIDASGRALHEERHPDAVVCFTVAWIFATQWRLSTMRAQAAPR